MGPLGTNIAGTPLSRVMAPQQYNAAVVLFSWSTLFRNQKFIRIASVEVLLGQWLHFLNRHTSSPFARQVTVCTEVSQMTPKLSFLHLRCLMGVLVCRLAALSLQSVG